jgi:hypothetical protein
MQIDAPLLHIAHSAASHSNNITWNEILLDGRDACMLLERLLEAKRHTRNFPCHAQVLLSDQPVVQMDAQK